MCIYMFVDKKLLNRTVVIDSPFQRFAVDFFSNLSSPEMLSSLNKSRLSLCNQTLLYCLKDDTIVTRFGEIRLIAS